MKRIRDLELETWDERHGTKDIGQERWEKRVWDKTKTWVRTYRTRDIGYETWDKRYLTRDMITKKLTI